MCPLLFIFGLFIVHCFAGEVSKLGYEPRYDYNYYRTDDKNDDKKVIGRTPNGHEFLLGVDYRRYIEYSSGLFDAGTIEDTKYQNIVQIYYDRYLLESVKIPRIDSLEDCTLESIDNRMFNSIHPKVPKPDSDDPRYIIIYYSFTDGDCVRGIYSMDSLNGRHYVKDYSDKVVSREYCK